MEVLKSMYRVLLCLFVVMTFSTATFAQIEGSIELKKSTDSSIGTSTAEASVSATDSANDTSKGSTSAAQGEYTYEGLLAIGHGFYVTQKFDAAVAQYEKARAREPARAEAYYFIGCVLKSQMKFQEAVSMLASAATVAGQDDIAMNARALFVVATVWEAAKNLEKAKYAWIQYKTFAKLHPEVKPFPDVADAHIAAIDARIKQMADYRAVTERIEANRE